MAVVNLIAVQGDSAQLLEGYDAINAHLRQHAEGPPGEMGMIHHICAATEDGILVIEVWESADVAFGFYRSELFRDAMDAAGFPPLSPEMVRSHEVHAQFAG